MSERRGLLARLNSLVRWLLFLLLVSAATAVICRHVVTTQLDEQIRKHIEAQLAGHYPAMDVRIQSARRVAGKGIEVRGLTISSTSEASRYRQLVCIDELFAKCDTDVAELILRDPCLRQIEIRRMRLQAARHADGSWNVAKLLPPPRFSDRLPTIIVKDSSVELCDLTKKPGGSCAVRSIQLTAKPASADLGPILKVDGTMHGDHFKQVAVEGFVDPQSGNWTARGTMDGLEMSRRLLGSLPSDVAPYLSVLATLRARAHLGFQIAYQRGAANPVSFTLQGRLTEGRLEDDRLPYPLTELSANIHCTNERLSIKDVVAQMGPSTLQLNVRSTQFLRPPLELSVVGSVQSLPLGPRLRAVLPQSLADGWDKFDPAGVVDVSANLTITDGQIQPTVTVDCQDVSFAYCSFPYRLQHGCGRIQLRNDVVTFTDFAAEAEGQTVYMSGEFQNPGPKSTGWLDIRTAGPIVLNENDAIVQAMTEGGRRVTRSLHPTGMVVLRKGRIEKRQADGPAHRRFEIELQGMSMQYDKFPYPFNRITGLITIEDQHWTFSNLRGYHGGSEIRAGGDWQPMPNGDPGGTLTLHFEGQDVALDEDLQRAVAALSEGGQQLWHNLRPRGTIDDLTVHIVFASPTRETKLSVRAEKGRGGGSGENRSLSIQPAWMPGRLDDVTGLATFDDGKFTLQNVQATHGQSRVELTGNGFVDKQRQWRLHLTRAIVDRLQLDQRLVDFLPDRMEAAVRQLSVQGPFSMNGSVWLGGGPKQSVQVGWDVLLDIENVSTAAAIGFEHIHGGIRLNGAMNQHGFASRGDIEIDSAIYRGVQVTQIQGPFWIDNQQLILGARADAGRSDRMPRQVVARTLGGLLAFDAHVSLADQLPYYAEISYTDGDLASIARATRAAQRQLSGKVYAMLQVSGTSAGKDSLRGGGHVRLRNADVYQLPVMVELLSFLSLRPPDRTGFTSADIDFRIQGDQLLHFDRIDFSGDAISLKGNGWMDLNRNVSLSFYALVGRYEFQLPIVRNLLAEASRNILAIQVVGTLDSPHVVSRPLPELEEALQRIFPEVYTRTAAPPSGARSQSRRSTGRQVPF